MQRVRRVDRYGRLRVSVLRALGYDQKEIAGRLGVSQHTVSYHLERFRRRAEEETPEVTFYRLVLAPLDVSIDAISTLHRIMAEKAHVIERRNSPKGGIVKNG